MSRRVPIRDYPAQTVPVRRVFSRTFADYLLSPEFVPLNPARSTPPRPTGHRSGPPDAERWPPFCDE